MSRFDPDKAKKCGCGNRTMNEDGVCVICKIRQPEEPLPPPAPVKSHKNPTAPKKKQVEKGAPFELIRSEAMNISPEHAQKYLELNVYEAQRHIKEQNLRDLVETIDEGRWRSAEISFAVMPSGKEILVNGQHTLRACVAAGEDIFVFLVWYRVSGNQGLSELYRTFDLGRSARSIGDAVKAEMHALGLDWPLQVASLITTAGVFMETGQFRGKLGKAKQSALLRKYTTPGGFVVTLIQENKKGSVHLKRGPVITAIVKTYYASEDAAWNFWTAVRDGHANPTMPSEILRNYLLDQPETWDRKALYAKCIEAFNAYVKRSSGVRWNCTPGAPLPEPITPEAHA